MKSRKKIIYEIKRSVFLILLSCIFSVYPASNKNLLSAETGKRTVIIGVYENSPKVFTSEDGKPSGIFIDIIEYIAKTENWTLKYVQGTWGEGLARLEKGELDLMPDVAYTDDRAKIFFFHKEPVLSSWSQVYARKGSGIKSILDLEGKRIAVLQASVQQEAFARLADSFRLKITLIPVPDYNFMFGYVADNKADAAVTNNLFGIMNAKKYGLEDTAVVFNPSALFFAGPLNASGELLNKIDSALTALKKDPRSAYHASLKRWTSEEIHFKFPVWIQIAITVIIFALIFSAGGSLVLKRRVNVRTRELNEALQRFTDIVEFLPDATFVIDQNKKVIAWNQACEALTGIKKESLLGKGDYAYAEPFSGEQRPILIDLLDLSEPEIEASYKYVQRTGNKLYAESFIRRFNNGNGMHLWGVASPLYDRSGRRSGAIESIRDVTEQKKTEEAHRISERKYRELVMLANSIILHWSRDGKILFMNEFGLRFFGYSEAELFGRHVIGTIVPESETSGRDLRSLMENICANTQEYERNINENIRKNGECAWIDWANKVLYDDKGQVKEILSIGSDITERKKANEKIRQLNNELKLYTETLEQRVAERTSELAAAMEKAQEADKIKSAFLATMSHELRTPLNSIIGFTGIMLQGLAGTLNNEQAKQMNMIQGSSRHLLSLINDVLDISKIEAGQLELSPQSFPLNNSIKNIIRLILPLAEKKNIKIRQDIPDNAGMITADQRRLEQIILNLLNNAVKFTEHGEILISCSIENGLCNISVSDTGIGMRQEDIPKLFRPFHQIDSGTSRKTEGTGLGLSICKKILDLMGGTISVNSRIGEGSTFSIQFSENPEATA